MATKIKNSFLLVLCISSGVWADTGQGEADSSPVLNVNPPAEYQWSMFPSSRETKDERMQRLLKSGVRPEPYLPIAGPGETLSRAKLDEKLALLEQDFADAQKLGRWNQKALIQQMKMARLALKKSYEKESKPLKNKKK